MSYHEAVLCTQAIDGLCVSGVKNSVYVDATFGAGGHTKEILKKLNKGSVIIAFDKDADAQDNIIIDDRLILIQSDFRFMNNFLNYYQVGKVSGIIADLGVSSHQIDEPSRGFSIRYDGENIDMRMDNSGGSSAFNIINQYSSDQLQNIFGQYGEISKAGRLARFIVEVRKKKPISTVGELKSLISSVIPGGKSVKIFAKVFQAIRIEVNDELGALKAFLKSSLDVLKTEGRLVVISYHSLEDRIVKNFMKSGNFEGEIEKDMYGNIQTPFKIITKKPIVPSEEEIKRNNRSRSAKLRIAEKI